MYANIMLQLYSIAYSHTQRGYTSRPYFRHKQAMDNYNRWSESNSNYARWYGHTRRHEPAYWYANGIVDYYRYSDSLRHSSYSEQERSTRERLVATSSINARRLSWPYPPKRPRPCDDSKHDPGDSFPTMKRAASPLCRGDNSQSISQSGALESSESIRGDPSLRRNRNPNSNPSSPSLRAILNLDDGSEQPASSQTDHRRGYRSHSPPASPVKSKSAVLSQLKHTQIAHLGTRYDTKHGKEQNFRVHPVIAGMSAEQEDSLEVLRTTLKVMRSQRALIEAQRGGDKRPSTAWRRGRPRSRPAAVGGSESRLSTLDLS